MMLSSHACRRFFLAVLMAVFGVGSFANAEEHEILELKELAPFVRQTKDIKASSFTPALEGQSITCGNKQLVIRKTGAISILTSGTDHQKGTINISPIFKTEFGYAGLGRYTKADIDVDKADKSLAIKVKLSKTKGNGKIDIQYSGKIKILEEGFIKLDLSWDVQDAGKRHYKSGAVYMKWDDSRAGEKLVYKNKTFTIDSGKNLGRKYNWVLNAKEMETIELFKNDPVTCFKIIPEQLDCMFVQSEIAYTGKQQMQMTIRPKNGSERVSFMLDLRAGIKREESQYTFGGIDFMSTEALEISDYGICRNLVKNPSFEQGFRNIYAQTYSAGRYFPNKAKWDQKDVEIDSTQARFGSNSLKLNTWCSGTWRKTRSEPFSAHFAFTTIPVEPGLYTLSFYAKGNRPGKQNIEVMHCGGTVTDTWKRYKKTIKVDKKRALQLHLCAKSKTKDGSVWLDGVQFEKGDKATDFTQPPICGKLETSALGNFLRYGAALDAKFNVLAKPNSKGKVRITVRDFFAKKLFGQSFPFVCDNNGKAIVKLPLDGKFQRGIYVLRSDYTLDSGEKTYELFRFSIMDFLDNKHRLKNLYSLKYGGTPENVPGKRRRLERWKQIGVGSISAWVSWQKDSYDLMQNYGIDPVDVRMLCTERERKLPLGKMFAVVTDGYIANGRKLLDDFRASDINAPLTEQYLDKFRKAVEKNARDCPWVKTWSMATEIGGGKKINLEYDDYLKLLKSFYHGIRDGNPKAKITNSAPCNMRPQSGIEEINELLHKLAGEIKFDSINIHCYRKRPEDPDLDSDFQYLFKMLDKHGYQDVPIILDEGTQWGPYTIPQWNIRSAAWTPPSCWFYSGLSYDIGWNEKISAAWRARTWLVALKYQDRIKCLCQADISNNSELDFDLTPRVTQKIPNTLGRLLGDAVFVKDIRFAPYTRCYIFEDMQKRPVAAVWGYHEKMDCGTMRPMVASAKFGARPPEVFDLMESRRKVTTDDKGNTPFPVSSFPVFFRGDSGDTPAFINAFTQASLLSSSGLAPVIVTAQPATPETILLKINNLMSRTFEGSVKINDKNEENINAPGSDILEVARMLPEKLSDDRIKKEHVIASITDASTGKEFKTNSSFDGFLCKKANDKITIDGDPNDWKGIPEIKFENRKIRNKKLGRKIDDSDFSGSFKVAWAEEGLYLCVNIQDDTFYHTEDVPRHSEGDLHDRWNNDSLQIYFDTLCDARMHEAKGYDTNDYDYAVFPNASGKNAISYRYRTPDIQLTLGLTALKDGTVAPEIPSAFKKTSEGYCYEVFFPKTYLLPFKPQKGNVVGFGLTVNDRDGGKGVKSSLTLPDDGGDCYNRPYAWPAMLLWD